MLFPFELRRNSLSRTKGLRIVRHEVLLDLSPECRETTVGKEHRMAAFFISCGKGKKTGEDVSKTFAFRLTTFPV